MALNTSWLCIFSNVYFGSFLTPQKAADCSFNLFVVFMMNIPNVLCLAKCLSWPEELFHGDASKSNSRSLNRGEGAGRSMIWDWLDFWLVFSAGQGCDQDKPKDQCT